MGGLLADRYRPVETIRASDCFPCCENNLGTCEPAGDTSGGRCVFNLVTLLGERKSAR